MRKRAFAVLLAITAIPIATIAKYPKQQKASETASHDENGKDKQPYSPIISAHPEQNVKLQAPAAEKSSESVDKDPPKIDWWSRIFSGLTAFGTLALAVIGAVAACIAIRTLRSIEKQTGHAATAADAAKDSADIAKLAMVASNRPYVHQQSFAYRPVRDLMQDRLFWRIIPIWRNSGNTPTSNLRILAAYELRDSPLPENFPFSRNPTVPDIPIPLSPNGTIEGFSYDLGRDDLVAISECRKYFYIWGTANYRDVFPGTAQHVTKFCFYISAVMGNPLADLNETNRVEIVFSTYHRHNCVDGDCEEKKTSQNPN